MSEKEENEKTGQGLYDDAAVRALVATYQADQDARSGKQAIHQLIKRSEGLIRRVAWQLHCRGPRFKDVQALGQLGIVEAAKRFDLERKNKFVTYATWWVRAYIVRDLRQIAFDKPFPLSYDAAQQDAAIRKACSDFAVRHGRSPDDAELLGLLAAKETTRLARASDQKLLHLRMIGRQKRTSLDGPALHRSKSPYDNAELSQAASEGRASLGMNPEAMLHSRRVAERVTAALARLPERERQVINMRFGLGDRREYQLRDIGKIFGGLSRQRIFQNEEKAIERLRTILAPISDETP